MQLACPKKKWSLGLFSALLLLILTFGPVQAQETMSLTATPVRVGDDNSLLLQPGDKKQIQVKVKNNSQADLVIESRSLDFIVADDGSTPVSVTEEQSDRWSLSSWMTLVPAINQVKAGDTAVINVLIEVPADALPGGHYAMVLHSPDTGAIEDTSGTGISQRVGTLVYVLVDGPISEAAYVSRFNVARFLENGPVPVEIKIKNESDTHISPMPILRIYNLFGKEVDTVTLEQKNIFPETERAFDTVWDRVWGFGPYTMKLEAAYGRQGQVAMAEGQIWLVPVRLIIITLLGGLTLIALILLIKKKRQPAPETTVDQEPESTDEAVADEKNQA